MYNRLICFYIVGRILCQRNGHSTACFSGNTRSIFALVAHFVDDSDGNGILYVMDENFVMDKQISAQYAATYTTQGSTRKTCFTVYAPYAMAARIYHRYRIVSNRIYALSVLIKRLRPVLISCVMV